MSRPAPFGRQPARSLCGPGRARCRCRGGCRDGQKPKAQSCPAHAVADGLRQHWRPVVCRCCCGVAQRFCDGLGAAKKRVSLFFRELMCVFHGAIVAYARESQNKFRKYQFRLMRGEISAKLHPCRKQSGSGKADRRGADKVQCRRHYRYAERRSQKTAARKSEKESA